MSAPKKRPAAKPRAAALPPVTVARFEEATKLVERLVDTSTDLFIQRGQEYREKHRAGTRRPLTAEEAGMIASALATQQGEPPLAFAEQVQASGLRAHEEPAVLEVLLAAGIATAPAFTGAVLRIVALIEMPADAFREHVTDDTLDDALDRAAEDLRWIDLAAEGRDRANRAFEHFARAAGVEPGKAVGLISRAIWQALQQAMTHLGASPSASLTGSAANTDGVELTSSTP